MIHLKRRIIEYRKRIDELLNSPSNETDWNDIMNEHLIQISFFQHERLIHLIVTVTFAIMTIISVGLVLILDSAPLILLTVLLLLLLVPYIAHYYTLENEVQKMYCQYDRILKNIRKR